MPRNRIHPIILDESVKELLRQRQEFQAILVSSDESGDEVGDEPIALVVEDSDPEIRVIQDQVFPRGRQRADVPPRHERDNSIEESRSEPDGLED